jgi:hypothetical protein
VLNGNVSAGVLQFWTCNGTASQQWQQKGAQFIGLGGECLDVLGANTTPGATVHLSGCNGTVAQNWSLINAPTILQGVGTKCLDIINGNTSPGARLQIFECNSGRNAQIFTFTAASEIRNEAGECLDVSESNAAAGQVQMWPCNGGTNQKWRRGPGRQIASELSGETLFGFCLGTATSLNAYASPLESSLDRTAVGLEQCNGVEAQQWVPANLYVNGPATLLIVTSAAFAPTFTNFVAHKQSIGIATKLLTMSQITAAYPALLRTITPSGYAIFTNDDPLSLKMAIADYYQNLGTKYVLLGGDNSQVPMRYREVLNGDNTTHSFHFADLYYENLYSGHWPLSGFHGGFDNWDSNGDGYYDEQSWNTDLNAPDVNPDNVDGFPDIVVGRLPAYNTTSLTTILNKIINYENQNPLYGGRGFPPASQYGWAADACYSGAYNLARQIAGFQLSYLGFAEEVGGTDCGAPAAGSGYITDASNWSQFVTALQDSDYEWVTYVGHAGPTVWGYNSSFGYSQISGLSNQYLPMVFAVGCESAIIDGVGYAEYQDGDVGGTYPNSYTPPSYDPQSEDYSSINIGAHFLFNSIGGAVAYGGENLVMADDAGASFMTYLFQNQQNGYARLGDMWRMAQQQYFNANTYSTKLAQPVFSWPRIYLSIMNLFGDPSMRTQ